MFTVPLESVSICPQPSSPPPPVLCSSDVSWPVLAFAVSWTFWKIILLRPSNFCGDFDWNYIKSVYQFGKNWPFHDIESSVFEHNIPPHICRPLKKYFHNVLYFKNTFILRNFLFLIAIVTGIFLNLFSFCCCCELFCMSIL